MYSQVAPPSFDEARVDEQPQPQLSEREAKLAALRQRLGQARQLNHSEVVEESQREAKGGEGSKRRAEWHEKEEKRRAILKEQGVDYAQQKIRGTTAADAEWHLEKQRDKARKQVRGYDFDALNVASYNRRLETHLAKDARERYENEKKRLIESGVDVDGDALATGLYDRADRAEDVQRMKSELAEHLLKRVKRRVGKAKAEHHVEKDVDYINERNRRFNLKIEKAFGQYTGDIKQNLERGTALE